MPEELDQELKEQINKYLKYEKIAEHKKYIETLVRENNVPQLKRLIGKRLCFGTAGIRGSMGAGFGQMNDLVIIQTSQGLVSYLIDYYQKLVDKQEIVVKSPTTTTTQPKATLSSYLQRGVIIGFDARYNSDRFARLVAIAFLQRDIPVYFSDYIIPTPLIAFGVIKYKCLAGIVITASHNPKHDNGYKVYWSNGAQILSPHDQEIQRHILLEENQKPWQSAWRSELLNPVNKIDNSSYLKDWIKEKLIIKVYKDLTNNYYDLIDCMISNDMKLINQNSKISITYTTMHGVGHTFLTKALEIANFNDVYPVELQKKPDPEFSTVKFPNPEENGALDLAFETAKHANSNLILANDPDADRCAAALYEPKTCYKRVLNGNEIGSLLGWWLWFCFKEENELEDDDDDDDNNDDDDNAVNDDKQNVLKIDKKTLSPNVEAPSTSTSTTTTTTSSPSSSSNLVETVKSCCSKQIKTSKKIQHFKPNDCYMISTAVSSKFLYSMALIEGFHFVETLTGFKYMGNVANTLIKERKKKVLFAYEEAIGYMCNPKILDKDGISAAVQLAQCASFVLNEYNRTLEQHLDWLYSIYGFHYNLNSYYLCTDSKIITEIFTNLQSNYPNEFKLPSSMNNNETSFKVTRIRDLNNGYDSGMDDFRATLPASKSSYMLTFFINNNITFTIRTSGTEPKIKYYSEIVEKLPPLKGVSASALKENKFNISLLYDDKQLAAKEAARNKLKLLVRLAIEQCLKPGKYKLEQAN